MSKKVIASERHAALMILYEAGWSDGKIARAVERTPRIISNWRRLNGLGPVSRPRKIEDSAALAMYSAGASDGEIARRFGATQSGATRWRQRHGLATRNDQFQKIDPDRKRAARKMLRLGASRRQVSEATGIRSLSTVGRLRAGIDPRRLRATGVTNRTIRVQVLRDRTLEGRILDSVGRDLPREVRCEAFAELYTDVLEGRVARDFIEKVAPRYRNRAWEMNGSNFGLRSIDEELSDHWTLGDALEDVSALGQLELAAEAAYGNDNW